MIARCNYVIALDSKNAVDLLREIDAGANGEPRQVIDWLHACLATQLTAEDRQTYLNPPKEVVR